MIVTPTNPRTPLQELIEAVLDYREHIGPAEAWHDEIVESSWVDELITRERRLQQALDNLRASLRG